MKTIKQQLAVLILLTGTVFSLLAMAGVTTATPCRVRIRCCVLSPGWRSH